MYKESSSEADGHTKFNQALARVLFKTTKGNRVTTVPSFLGEGMIDLIATMFLIGIGSFAILKFITKEDSDGQA